MAHTFRNRTNSAQGSPLTANPSTFNHTPGARTTVIIVGLVIAGVTARKGGAPTIAGITATQLDSTRIAAEQITEFWYVTGVFDGSQITVSIPNTNAVSIHWECISADAGTGFTSQLNNASGDVTTGSNNGFTFDVTSYASGDFLYSRVGCGEAAPASITETSTNPTKTAGSSLDHGDFSSKSAYGISDGAGMELFVWVWSADDGGGSAVAFKSVASIEQATETDSASPLAKRIIVGQAGGGGGGDTGGIALANEDTSEFTSFDAIVSAIPAAKIHGVNGFRALWAGSSTSGMGYFSFTPRTTDTYARMYIQFDTGSTFGADAELNIMDLGRVAIFVICDASGVPTTWRLVTNTDYEDSSTSIVLDTPHCIELAWIKGTGANGGGMFWLDGTLSNSILNGDETAQSVSELSAGMVWAINPSSGTYIYFDDVKVDSSYIGLISTAGDLAQPISVKKLLNVVQTTETDLAQIITYDSGSQNINVIQATETDEAQAIGKVKYASVRQVTEAEAAQSISKSKLKSIGQISETETVFSITIQKLAGVGGITESDLAQVISSQSIKFIDVNQAVETDSAQNIGKQKFKEITQTVETDLSQTIGKSKLKLIDQASGTDLAQNISLGAGQQLINVYPVGAFYYLRDENGVYLFDENGVPLYTDQQSDFAFGIVPGTTTPEIDQVIEVDSSQPVGKRKSKSIAQTTETDLTQAISKKKSRSVTQVIETDSAQIISLPGEQNINVIQAVETDSAQVVGKKKYVAVQQSAENDSAQTVPHKKNKIVNAATELDESGAINVSGKINQANETDSAFALTVLKKIAVAQVTEADIVQTISKIKNKVLAQLTEVDLAGGITIDKFKQIQQASENDSSQLISILKKFNIGLASEADNAFQIYKAGAHLIALLTAFETDRAITIRDYDAESLGIDNIEGTIIDYGLEVTYANLHDPYLSLADADGKDFFDADDKLFVTADLFITNESIEGTIDEV